MNDETVQPDKIDYIGELKAALAAKEQEVKQWMALTKKGEMDLRMSIETVAMLNKQLAAKDLEVRSWKLAFEGLERQHKALTDQIPAERIDADPILCERVTTAAAMEEIGRQQITDLQQQLAAKDAEIARLSDDVTRLNNVLRNAGWGQGEIDSAACMEDNIDGLKRQRDEILGALNDLRDTILNGRGPLESVLDNDQTNAVLGAYDDALGAALAPQGEEEQKT